VDTGDGASLQLGVMLSIDGNAHTTAEDERDRNLGSLCPCLPISLSSYEKEVI